MQFGIFAKTFDGRDPHAVLKAVAEAGYGTCQYNMACSGLPSLPHEVGADVLNDIAEARTASGVGIAALSATWNMIHPDRAVGDAGLCSLNVLAVAARALQIPLLTLCSGSRNTKDQWAHHPDNQTPEAWKDLTRAMAQALDVAERFGVDLGVEPEHANVVDSAHVARRLLNEMQSPRLKIVLDPANLITSETGQAQKDLITAAFDLTGDAVALAHAKDRAADGKVVAAGNGIVNFPHLFSKLKELGRDVPIITHGLHSTDAGPVSLFLKTTWEHAG